MFSALVGAMPVLGTVGATWSRLWCRVATHTGHSGCLAAVHAPLSARVRVSSHPTAVLWSGVERRRLRVQESRYARNPFGRHGH